MRTLGIDLSADDRRTAACTITWGADGSAEVVFPHERKLTNDDLRQLAGEAEWVGIDAPFGWPAEFVKAVVAHAETGRWPPEDKVQRKDIRYRQTDRLVEEGGRRPLSVSTDRIAVTAMRCAHLLEAIADDRGARRLDLTGGDKIVEVYPAAALAAWSGEAGGLDPDGYKGTKGTDKRAVLIERLSGAAPWLRLSAEAEQRCARSDDALDALVAALVTRAAARDQTRSPATKAQERLAAVEGWIHVPLPASLSRLPST